MSTTTSPALPSPRQSELVVARVKDMIRNGDLVAGQRLPIEKHLALQLEVSRGSLREGVRALCMMGVLETRQGDGTYVTTLDPALMLAPLGFLADVQDSSRGIADLQSIRRVLEAEAAQHAAVRVTDEALEAMEATLRGIEPLLAGEPSESDHEQILSADQEFHRLIAESSGNRSLAALVEALASRTLRGRLWRALHDEGAAQRTHDEHRAILRALQERNPSHAGILMGHHLLGVESFLRAHDDLLPGE